MAEHVEIERNSEAHDKLQDKQNEPIMEQNEEQQYKQAFFSLVFSGTMPAGIHKIVTSHVN